MMLGSNTYNDPNVHVQFIKILHPDNSKLEQCMNLDHENLNNYFMLVTNQKGLIDYIQR